MKDAIKQKIVEKTNQIFSQMYLMKDATNYAFVEDEYLQSIEMQALNLADGSVEIRLVLKPEYYYSNAF